MKNQEGAALIVVLSLLTVSLMIGISTMQTSQIDERLAGNYKAQSELQMAAEEAVASAWSNVLSTPLSSVKNLFVNEVDISDYADAAWSGFEALDSAPVSCGVSYCSYSYVVDRSSGVPHYYIVGISALSGEGGKPIGQAFPVVAEIKFGEILNPAFNTGLLSADYINVTGQSNVYGDVHSNGSVSISIENDQYTTDADGNTVQNWSMTEGGDQLVDIPLPGDRPSSESDLSSCGGDSPALHCYKDYQGDVFSQYKNRPGVIESCSVDISNLNNGDTVFCDEIETKGDNKGGQKTLVVGGGSVEGKNITLVSLGDVTMNGSTTTRPPKDAEIGLYVIAGGDVTFNGSTDNYGIFWAAGRVRQNGNSSLYGSIVSGTYIRSNGGIDFTSINNVSNPDTFIEVDPYIVSWK